MKEISLVSLIFLIFVQNSFASSLQWQLPIQLGEMSDSVHETLGPPTETVSADSMREKHPEVAKTLGELHNEYFYSSGIVARFHKNKVFGITINSHSSYQGWIIYQGKILKGVTLSDTYSSVIEKLGMPTKVEEMKINESKDDLDNPVVFPGERRCYWRNKDFTVQINFLLQARSVSEGVVAPRGSISIVLVYK